MTCLRIVTDECRERSGANGMTSQLRSPAACSFATNQPSNTWPEPIS